MDKQMTPGKDCFCCNGLITKKSIRYPFFCKKCIKKINEQIHKLRRKEYPFNPFKWNFVSNEEFMDIMDKIRNEN